MNEFRQSRQIWRRAHPVRLPSKNTQVHDELRAARIVDLIKAKRFEEELAGEMDIEFAREEGA
jgi:hypothetical protein